MDGDYPLPAISEALFPELRDLMLAEPDFPQTYPEWLAMWQRRRMEEERRGQSVFFVEIRPDDYVRFCAMFTPSLPYRWGSLTKYVESTAATKAGR
jgi:hypothetical protein